ncbi:MAG: hypothetical protein AAB405_01045 [Patescibacteria group bacterium]
MKTFSKFLNKINFSGFDFFSLGNSAILYYFLIFYLKPISEFLGISEDLIDNKFVHYKIIFYITIGFIFLIIGYFSQIHSIILRKSSNFLKQKWDFNKALWIFAGVFILSLIVKAIRIFGGGYSHLYQNPLFIKNHFYNLVGLLDWLAYIALIIAFASYFSLRKDNDERYKIWRFIAWGTLIIEIIYALPSCSRMPVIIPILLYLIIRWHIFEKKYLKTVTILFFSILFLFPFGSICRLPAYTDLTHKQVIQLTIGNNIISGENKQTITSTIYYAGNFVIKSFFLRIDQSAIFSGVIKYYQSFSHGATFRELLFVFGPPRFLWNNKPPSMNVDGNSFGHKIHILSDNDFKTSVGPTVLGDWYINFGLVGIIFGMFFMGALFRLIYEYLIKMTEVSLSGVMIYSVLWIQIIKGMEDWIAPVYVGIIRITVILIIIHFLLIKKTK